MDRLPLGKECNKCKEWKLLEEFHRCKEGRFGRYWQCKPCRALHKEEKGWQTAAEYRDENREQMRARDRERYRHDPEHYKAANRDAHSKHKEQRNAESRRRYRENVEARRAYARWYQQMHRGQRSQYLKQYRHENRDKLAFYRLRRRDRKRGNGGGGFTRDEWLALCAQYGNRCLCCGEAGELHVDHVLPLSKGGEDCISNVQPLCPTCNRVKSAKMIDYRH